MLNAYIKYILYLHFIVTHLIFLDVSEALALLSPVMTDGLVYENCTVHVWKSKYSPKIKNKSGLVFFV